MLKFDEEKQLASVQGALALRPQIEAVVDGICKDGFRNLCWLGIGGTYASCLQALFVENAAEYLTTGSRRVGDGTIVVISSVTGSTEEMVRGVEKAKAAGARVLGFIDVETAQLAGMVDWEIAYPANEQLKFFMVADMYNRGEFPEYDEYYAQLDAHLARDLVEVEKAADAFGLEFAQKHHDDRLHYFVGAGNQYGSTLLGGAALDPHQEHPRRRVLPRHAGNRGSGHPGDRVCGRGCPAAPRRAGGEVPAPRVCQLYRHRLQGLRSARYRRQVSGKPVPSGDPRRHPAH